MNTVLVTGANSGLGFESCKLLATKYNVKKIILACRSEAKANAAIDSLVQQSGKPRSTFNFIIMDTSDSAGCLAAAEALTYTLDGIILNAGGMVFEDGKLNMKDGSLSMFAVNVIGHAVFLEHAIEKKKLNPKARIIYAGSEAARGVAFMGMRTPKFKLGTVEELRSIITGRFFKKYDAPTVYGYVKCIAALYMSSMARKHPSYYFLTISPGMTSGTGGLNGASFPTKQLFNTAYFIMGKIGNAHNVTTGAERYMTGLFEDEYPSGRFIASKSNRVSGKLVDQSSIRPKLYGQNISLEDNAYDAVHAFIQWSALVVR